MDYLVKIDQRKRYVRITIPNKICQDLELKKYPYARVRVIGERTIEVEGVEFKERDQA